MLPANDPAPPSVVSIIKGLENSPSGPHDGGMDDTWRRSVDDRLAALERAVAELKGLATGSKTLLAGLVALVAVGFTLTLGAWYQTYSRIDRLEARFDAIPQQLTDEFRAMRAETAAQTAAIAASITATRQQAPQVLLIPAPTVATQPAPAPTTPP